MPSKSWRKSLSIIERIINSPKDFSFVQLVRLLERASVIESQNKLSETKISHTRIADNAVARYSPPTRESIRFASSHSLDFPDKEISRVMRNKAGSDIEQWQVLVEFMGLSGAMGVMPFHYSELIIERLKKRDRSLAHFLDMFNHRTVSLFYQASTKYNLPIEYERTKLFKHNKQEDSPHTQAMLSLLGLGAAHLRNRQQLRDESLIYFSGHLTQQIRTQSGLNQMIEAYFDVPVQSEGFVGQWQELIDDVRSRLPNRKNPKGQNACLGRSAMLGRKGWFAQGKSRIKIGPLDDSQFEKFAPNTGALKALKELVSAYLGVEEDFDFVIQVNREKIPNKVALIKDNPPQLAWNAWLSGRARTKTYKDGLMEVKVSSNSC